VGGEVEESWDYSDKRNLEEICTYCNITMEEWAELFRRLRCRDLKLKKKLGFG